MATIYVGTTSAGAANGTSWANRYGSLNAAEDKPVQAGDTVIVGPGVYRELLTCDVSGSSGSPITYVGDVTGAATDGVGGVVFINGSDNDQASTRNYCITGSKDYRTWRGLTLSHATNGQLNGTGSYCTVEDCVFLSHKWNGSAGVAGVSASTNLTVRRCLFVGGEPLSLSNGAATDDRGHLIEDCLLLDGRYGFTILRVGGITIRNCTIVGFEAGIFVEAVPNAGQTVTVQNCIVAQCKTGLWAVSAGSWITEDYNSVSGCLTARSNVSAGANSNTYPPLFALPMLHNGQVLPVPPFGTLSEWSQVKRIAGTGEATDDLFGRTRPATSSKKSWGAVQYNGIARETTTIDGGSGASLKLDDAGRVAWRVPVTAVSTTISVKVYREADYAGTAPQMVIKQPGQADRTTTDAGSASAWNTLTDTFTPAASPPYVVVEVVSSNTATSGNYDTFVDTLSVS